MMTRKEFLKTSALLGLASPFLASLLTGCETEDPLQDFTTDYTGKVLIIGAGSAGITAGYILNRYGVDFEILEAAPIHGGRIKKTDSLVDFPIDLGAEWIHTDGGVFSRILKDSSLTANIEVLPYTPETLGIGSSAQSVNVGTNFYGELKFKNSTWYDFFDQYLVPGIQDRIVYDSPVTDIDYSGSGVTVTTADTTQYTADRVIITVPLTILQQDRISFSPAFPDAKKEAMDQIEMPAGFKAFIEFSEKFYKDIAGSTLEDVNSDEHPRIFYDAAFRKDSTRHVLGLFTIGDPAQVYSDLNSDAEKIAAILADLDALYDGKASETYINHVIQDWTNEPYIRGAYSIYPNEEETLMNQLILPVDNKLFFAGEAYSTIAYATVHGAALSAWDAVELVLQA